MRSKQLYIGIIIINKKKYTLKKTRLHGTIFNEVGGRLGEGNMYQKMYSLFGRVYHLNRFWRVELFLPA